MADRKRTVDLTTVVPMLRIKGAEPLPEAEHFYTCHYCEQAVDIRRLRDVLYHDKPGHLPLQR
jgi:hypothetical protein